MCRVSLQTKRSKLILMIWCPDTAKIKKKMIYSSSFDALKHALVGIGKYIQVGSFTYILFEIFARYFVRYKMCIFRLAINLLLAELHIERVLEGYPIS